VRRLSRLSNPTGLVEIDDQDVSIMVAGAATGPWLLASTPQPSKGDS
jgi:hypothetical protein